MAKEKETKKEETKSTALAVLKADNLLPAETTFDQLKENLEGMDDIQFPRLRVLNDGFIYTSDDKSDKSTTVEGTILYYTRRNTYWKEGYNKNNPTPPECVSLDGKTGSKYGDCRTCQFNQFGSAKNGGKGKACRNQILMYIQIDGMAIPFALFIAPSNLPAFNNDFMMKQVTQKVLAFWQVKVRITAYKNDDDQYTSLKFDVVGTYKGEDLEKVKQIKNFWQPMFSQDSRNLAEDGGNQQKAAAVAAEPESAPSTPVTAVAEKSEKSEKVVTPKSKVSTVVDDDEPPF